jgi:tetratricopeptide (TPR) repeat protein
MPLPHLLPLLRGCSPAPTSGFADAGRLCVMTRVVWRSQVPRFLGNLALCGLFSLVAGWPSTRAAMGADEAQMKAADERIAKLIQQLGAEQFLVRERAQAELERIGVSAFDALDEARDSDDIEVAMRVRYLLRILSANWSQEEDTPEVKAVLKGYGEQLEAERKSRMERLAAFGHNRALASLCRLARFETNQALSKEAALMVMMATEPTKPEDRKTLAASVRMVVGDSRRPAAHWLRAFAQTLEDPQATRETWQRVVDQEVAAVNAMSSTTNTIVGRDLLRWHCDYLRRLNAQGDAEGAARRLVATVEGTPAELAELVGWLMERQYWGLVQELAARFPKEFDKSPPLIYRRAESLVKQGNKVDGEALAEAAFKSQPESAQPHLEMALELRDRGLFPWSEREFRKVLSLAASLEQEELNARYRFSEMLYDLERPLEAAEIWKTFIDRMDADPASREQFANSKQFFRSRMHYFFASHYSKTGDLAKAREHLDQGIRIDPNDADVLIAMFRLPGADEAWKRRVSALISQSAAHFLDLVHRWEQLIDQAPAPEIREEALENLANCCNQYAWLVGNTEGNFDEAVRLSHRSIELMPKTASYLDTLAHCYFAKRDYASAVKFQSLAARREPHSQQILRQLRVFERALSEKAP